MNIPNKELYSEFCSEISHVYSNIVDIKFNIKDQIDLIPQNKLTAKARIDIWFEEPYNFICEFDEIQHFNQFRQRTLENSYTDFNYSFDYKEYLEVCNERILTPGTSGFYKLRSNDNLFTPMYIGEKQDNRLRQRAFRDFLKEIVPVKLGFNPTVRISNSVTNGRINDFTNSDIEAARKYLYEIDMLEKVKIDKYQKRRY